MNETLKKLIKVAELAMERHEYLSKTTSFTGHVERAEEIKALIAEARKKCRWKVTGGYNRRTLAKIECRKDKPSHEIAVNFDYPYCPYCGREIEVIEAKEDEE